MKPGWQLRKIGDYCEVIAGQSPEGRYYNSNGHGMPFYQGKKDFGERFIEAPTVWTTETTKVARKNDILMSVRAPVGPVNLATEDICIGRGLAAIRCNDQLELDFLFYQLLHLQPEISGREGAVFASINKSEIAVLPIAVGPLPEQQRIVTLLDEAFDGIATAKAHAEKNLKNARELFASHLHAVFSLDAEGRYVKPIGDVCNLLNGFAFKSDDAVTESQTQLVRMGNLYGNALNLDRSPIFYPDSFAVEYERYLLKEGDLIMSLTGTTGKEDYGYAVRISDPGHQLLMNQRIAKFDLINMDVVTADYLFYYLRSRVFLDILYPTANGTRQANLSSATIKTLPIPLCPISEQKRKVRALDEVANESQRLESIYQQKLTALDELKKSLLHQAFSGQL